MNTKSALELILDAGGKLVAVLLTLFALYKATLEYFKSQVQIAKEKSTGETAIKTLEDASHRMQEEIDRLKRTSGNQEEEIERLQRDFNDLMKRMIDFHFKS